MSYVAVPRRGYGGYNDLPGADPLSVPSVASYKQQATAAAVSVADQSKQQAINFANQQLQNYPSETQVLAEYNEYSAYLNQIPNFNPADLQDPDKVVDLMKQGLMIYAKANGYPTNTADAEKQLEEYALSCAASQFGVNIPTNWPSNLKDLRSVATDLACTGFLMTTGVDPRLLTVTVDALMDGKLSPDECEAIGATAGAIAGAAIGQAFGIPAPIGAFIGGLVGQDIGGTLGEIFGAGPSGTDEINARFAAAKSLAQATLDQANAACSKSRSVYWDTFDQLLLATELQWETTEEQIGWRFNLRWFGIETWSSMGQAFSHAWDPAAKRFTGALTTANRASQIGSGTPMESYYLDNGVQKVNRTMTYTYGCVFDFGCPYPVVTGIPLPTNNTARVAEAFLARGILWLPPEQRSYQCSYPAPSTIQLFDGNAKAEWLAGMQIDLRNEQNAIKALQILSVTVVGDLVKTAATVAAEKKLNDILKASASTLNHNQLARSAALAQAKVTGQNLSDLLNYGIFALGAGLLGATLWKNYR